MKPKHSDPTESVDVEVEQTPFTFEGEKFSVSATVTHNLTEEGVGIGWYEYWGHMENDDRTWLTSNFEDAEFGTLEIWHESEDMPLANPPEALVEAAKEAAFHESYERAEDRANNP